MATTIKIDDEARDVLRRCTFTATELRLPDRQLQRPLYAKVDKAISACGGKWNRGRKAHVFEPEKLAAFRALFKDGDAPASVPNVQQITQQFFTPPENAERLVALADVHPGMRCLEPSAGRGAIVAALCRRGAYVVGIDNDPKMMVFGFTGGMHPPVQMVHADFMTADEGLFDRVVMNPPFSLKQDIRHVTRAFGMLHPASAYVGLGHGHGGILVSVMSPSIEFNASKEHVAFRKLLSAHGEIVERWPAGTFEDTSIETIVVRMTR